jgi:hypothetical protein
MTARTTSYASSPYSGWREHTGLSSGDQISKFLVRFEIFSNFEMRNEKISYSLRCSEKISYFETWIDIFSNLYDTPGDARKESV